MKNTLYQCIYCGWMAWNYAHCSKCDTEMEPHITLKGGAHMDVFETWAVAPTVNWNNAVKPLTERVT